MSEVNYNETVVIPFLQKKFQELVNNNLVLEVNLMVEQNKNKDLIEKMNNTIQTFGQEIAKRDDMISDYKVKYNQLELLQSELHKLKKKTEDTGSDSANVIHINRTTIREQQVIIEDLKTQLNTARSELQILKSPKKKKTQQKADILDGDVY